MTATTITATAPSAAAIEAIKQKAKTVEHSFDDVDNRGWFRTSDILGMFRGRAGWPNFFYAMKFDSHNPGPLTSPEWAIVVLSKGHAAPVLLLRTFSESGLMTLREFSSELEAIRHRVFRVDAATGSLARDYLSVRGSRSARVWIRVQSVVYVLVGDGEMAEGQVWERQRSPHITNSDNLTVLLTSMRWAKANDNVRHDMEIYRKKFDSEGWATGNYRWPRCRRRARRPPITPRRRMANTGNPRADDQKVME